MTRLTKVLAPIFILFSRIPLPILFIFSDLMYFVMYYIIRYRKKMVRANMRKSFPEKNLKEIISIERKFYHHLCDTMMESVRSLTMSKEEFERRIKFKNTELFQIAYDQNKSVAIYMAHLGNWEWFSFLPVFIPNRVCALYQPLKSNLFDYLIKRNRERFGVIAIRRKKAYRILSNYDKENIKTATMFLGDQRPSRKSSKHWVRFLNQDSAFSVGTDRIAKKLESVVVFPEFSKIKRGHYEVEFHLITDQVNSMKGEDIIENYAKRLEAAIRKQPEIWLWSHNRWKYKKEIL